MAGNANCPPLKCPKCGVRAHANAGMLFGSSYLSIRDDHCSFLVPATQYVSECAYVSGPRDGFFSVTDNPCPNLKQVIGSGWRVLS